jgi:hypothetical protein
MDAMPREPDIPSTTRETVTTAPVGDQSAYVYFSRGDELVVATRELGSRSTEAIVNALAAGPSPDEAAAGMISQLPPGVEVLSAEEAGGVLRLNLSEEFDNIAGRSKAQAAAQIVFSVTERSDIEEVVFFVEGDLSSVTSPLFGDTNRVSACDFVPYLADEQTLTDYGFDAEAVDHVTERRNNLAGRCPVPGS